jgi:hypothetical protein
VLNVSILQQPDYVSCGPTCLQALYQYYNDDLSIQQIINEIPALETYGTLAVLLGCHALNRGYQVNLHAINLYVFDPSWFKQRHVSLIDKLKKQLEHAQDQKIHFATKAYIQFLQLGGKIHCSSIKKDLICDYLSRKIPMLTGVNATYFYQTMRDYTPSAQLGVYDEWEGEQSGHFIVIHGYHQSEDKLSIADPFVPHPISRHPYYAISYDHWLHAHLLGAVSYDTELLAIWR